MKYLLIRTVTKDECPWLKHDVQAGGIFEHADGETIKPKYGLYRQTNNKDPHLNHTYELPHDAVLSSEYMSKSDWFEATIVIKVGNKKNKFKFKIYHNLDVSTGASIEDAYENWLARTEEISAKSFVDYINSKTALTNAIAFTKEQWEEFMK